MNKGHIAFGLAVAFIFFGNNRNRAEGNNYIAGIEDRHRLKTAPADYQEGNYSVQTKNFKIFGDNVDLLAQLRPGRAASVILNTKYQDTIIEKNGTLYIVTHITTDRKTGQKKTTRNQYYYTEFEQNYRWYI